MPVDVHYVADGLPGADVVVLAGSLGSTVEMWEPQLPALAERYRVVRYDQRGHGRSPVPPGPYSIEDLARDAIGLLDRIEVERASFCGLSIGGMVGIWLAAHAPDRIDRLVLLCTSALLGPPEAWAERAATVRAHGVEAVADTVIERWFTRAFAEREPELVARMRAMLVAIRPDGYAECCGAIERMDLRDDLARISAPTLVICGDQDPATPPEHGRLIAASVSNARLELLPAAHLANVEQAERVTNLIHEHLTEEER